MSLLTEVGAYLVAEGLGVLQTTLFLGRLTETGGDVVVTALFTAAGLEPIRSLETPGALIDQPGLDVVVRGSATDAGPAYDHADAVYHALARVTNMTLSGVRYQGILPLSAPMQQGEDHHDRPLLGFRCLVQKAPAA